MSLLFRCVPLVTRLTSAHGRVQSLRSVNQSIHQPLRQPVVPLSAFSRNFSGYGDEYEDMDDTRDDRLDEEYDDDDDMREEEEQFGELSDKASRRSEKGSKHDRMKLIQKEKRRQKMLLRARISKLDGVKPGSKPKRVEDYFESEPLDDDDEDTPDTSEASLREKPSRDDEQPVNEQIQGDILMIIGPDGKKIGLADRQAAMTKVRSVGLDLVQLSPAGVVPPVCKVVKYQEWVKAESLKRGSISAANSRKTKTLMIRPTIAPHDLETKMKQAKRFLRDGNSVKVTYLAIDPKPEDWIPFFDGISKHLAGIGKCEDDISKPFATYNTVHNKQSRKKSEKQSKEKGTSAESKSATQSEAVEVKVQPSDESKSATQSEAVEIKQ